MICLIGKSHSLPNRYEKATTRLAACVWARGRSRPGDSRHFDGSVMASDPNPYDPPKSREPRPGEPAPRKLFSFTAALELFVVLAIVMTLISLLLPFIR